MSSNWVLRCVVGRDFVVFPLLAGTVTIGRAPDCDIRLDDSGISRQHARLEIADQVWVHDLASANGTFISGSEGGDEEDATTHLSRERIEPGTKRLVRAGDILHIGAAMCILERVKPRKEVGPPVILDPNMENVYALVERIADAPISVLILGDTGVGKEVLAETIVARSRRASKPFLRLNCAAFQENLLESELFGYERGAFTGALKAKLGLFEAASGGTVFLDEIGEIPPTTQVKLLRVLEARQVQRIGALAPKPIDVRFISATNRNLEQEVRRGAFREDLFFRLNGITLYIPPLRERPSEIEPLARKFAQQAALAMGRSNPPELGRDALDALHSYSWRGNIRELKNVIERAVALSAGAPISLAHLPPELLMGSLAAPGSVSAAAGSVEEVTARHAAPDLRAASQQPPSDERERVLWALDQCAGNQTRAAKLLGISRTTLVARLEQFGVPRPRK